MVVGMQDFHQDLATHEDGAAPLHVASWSCDKLDAVTANLD